MVKLGFVDSRAVLQYGTNSFTLITRTWRIAIGSNSGGSGVSYQHALKIVKLDGRPKLVLDYVMLSRIAALLTVVGARFIRRNAK